MTCSARTRIVVQSGAAIGPDRARTADERPRAQKAPRNPFLLGRPDATRIHHLAPLVVPHRVPAGQDCTVLTTSVWGSWILISKWNILFYFQKVVFGVLWRYRVRQCSADVSSNFAWIAHVSTLKRREIFDSPDKLDR